MIWASIQIKNQMTRVKASQANCFRKRSKNLLSKWLLVLLLSWEEERPFKRRIGCRRKNLDNQSFAEICQGKRAPHWRILTILIFLKLIMPAKKIRLVCSKSEYSMDSLMKHKMNTLKNILILKVNRTNTDKAPRKTKIHRGEKQERFRHCVKI